jgi:hypothetical protein
MEHYSRAGVKVNNFALTPVVLTLIARRKFKSVNQIIRFVRITNIQETTDESMDFSAPIELLIVCGSKDIEILPIAIKSVFRFSANPVNRVNVIVPARLVEIARSTIDQNCAKDSTPIYVSNEDDVVSEKVRSLLKASFGDRYGWILQQVIKLQWTLESNSKAVLVLDADTVLLKPFYGIDLQGNQIFSLASELQTSYFNFLDFLGIDLQGPKFSTITHHMVFQPRIVKEMFASLNLADPEQLVEKVLEFKSRESDSSVSLDYEMYGQYMRKHHHRNLRYQHFSNRSAKRDIFALEETNRIVSGEIMSKYRSYSFHAYLNE